MGYANIGAELRDRVAEIVRNAKRRPQEMGEVTEGDYAVADEIIALVMAAVGRQQARAAEE